MLFSQAFRQTLEKVLANLCSCLGAEKIVPQDIAYCLKRSQMFLVKYKSPKFLFLVPNRK